MGMDDHGQARWNPRNISNHSSCRHDGRHVAIAPKMRSETLIGEFMAATCARHTKRAFTDLADKDLPELRTTLFRQQRRKISEAVTDVLYQPRLDEGRRSRYRYTIELVQASSRWRTCQLSSLKTRGVSTCSSARPAHRSAS